MALGGAVDFDWNEVWRLEALPDTVVCRSAGCSCVKLAMNSKSKIPSIPIDEAMGLTDWLRGRRKRRELGNLVAPGIIRRETSSSDRRLRKLFKGERGLPFKPTEEL